MSERSKRFAELQELLDAVLEETATEATRARLKELLEDDPEARRFYVDYLHIESMAYWEHGHVESDAGPGCPSESLPAERSGFPETARSPLLGFLGECWQWGAPMFSGIPVGVLTLSVLTGTSFLMVLALFVLPQFHGRPLPLPTEPPSLYVARLTGTVNCRWAPRSLAPIVGARLPREGRLVLNEGLAEITFNSGARVILQGPATLILDTEGKVGLDVGKLTAEVPKEAIGFTVRAPGATVVDLGTEFGVEVDQHRTTGVHVFRGVVTLNLLAQANRNETKKTVQLSQGEAVRINPQKKTLHREPIEPEQFVRHIKPEAKEGIPNGTVIAYWRFEKLPPHADGPTVQDAVLDASGNGHSLSFWTGGEKGWGRLRPSLLSPEVPRMFSFIKGHSAGERALNNNALAAEARGMLYYGADPRHQDFSFADDFTIEGFFKTDGDRSEAGRMDILFQSSVDFRYLVNLNEGGAGVIRFTHARQTTPVSGALHVDMGGLDDENHNFANGKWHYFVARYDNEAEGTRDRVTLTVVDEEGKIYSGTSLSPPNFTQRIGDGDLIIGRWKARSMTGHFRGLLDEIRISRGVLRDSDLLIQLKSKP